MIEEAWESIREKDYFSGGPLMIIAHFEELSILVVEGVAHIDVIPLGEAFQDR